MYAQADTDFELDKHLIPYLQEVPFFAELSRQLRKTPTIDKKMPTAGVSFNPETDEIVLYWNPNFFNKLSNWQVRGVLTHEFYHLVFGHLNARRKKPAKLWNVATDLAINSIIVSNAKDSMPRDAEPGDTPLPDCVLIPGQFPKHPEGREFSAEEKEGMKIGAAIAGFPKMMASEWYFHKLLEAQKEQNKGQREKGQKGGQGTPGEGDPGEGDEGGDLDDLIESMDDHSMWDDVPEEYQDYVEGRVKAMVEKAVKYADSHPQGWGNMPSDLVSEIRKSVSQVVNWRQVLRQFIGSLIRGSRSSSIKRINKRYPYVHPGVKRGYNAKLLIAMDQSGSVPDEMVSEFFAELRGLTKRISIDVLPFDSEANEKQIMPWNKGAAPKLKRVKHGGTSFDAPTRVFNDPKNRGRWDGMLVMTDGECSQPGPARKKRGWIMGKGHKLMFPSDELQIFLDKDQPMAGAWR